MRHAVQAPVSMTPRLNVPAACNIHLLSTNKYYTLIYVLTATSTVHSPGASITCIEALITMLNKLIIYSKLLFNITCSHAKISSL